MNRTRGIKKKKIIKSNAVEEEIRKKRIYLKDEKEGTKLILH